MSRKKGILRRIITVCLAGSFALSGLPVQAAESGSDESGIDTAERISETPDIDQAEEGSLNENGFYSLKDSNPQAADCYTLKDSIPSKADFTVSGDFPEEAADLPRLAPASVTTVPGWNYIDGYWYWYTEDLQIYTGWLFDEGHWFYLQEDTGRMKTGWLRYKKKWYHFSSNGFMAWGWKKIGGKWYYFTDSGAMKTGWLWKVGAWYYLMPNGAMHTGWLSFGSTRYYMRPNGKMQTGWGEIDGKWYFFQTNGLIRTGWLYLRTGHYYLTATGPAATDGWLVENGHYYHFNETGLNDQDLTTAPSLVEMPGYYISPLYAGQYNTSAERIEAMIKRAYDYKNAGTTYKICKSQKPGEYADCSGLVMQCLYAAGFDPSPATPAHHALPENEYDSRTLFNQVNMKHVSYSERKRGDLIFYRSEKANVINHIAIYLGDDKVIESWPPAVTDKYGVTSYPHKLVYGVARPFE